MVHSEQFVIAGLIVNVFSLAPLAGSSRSVVALFFLHGRQGSASAIDAYTEVILGESRPPQGLTDEHDLIVVTFDHRNHGSRLRAEKANDSWSKKPGLSNERHALDMYAIQNGTAEDVSFLIDFLPAYLFPEDSRAIRAWGVAGKSLGGHSTWLALAHDERISFGAPIIACPDYLKLMRARAIKHSIPIEPPHFPVRLIEMVGSKDPVKTPYDRLDATNPFLGKKIIVMSGAADKLVPWEASEDFVEKLQVGPSGVKKTMLLEGVGHECTIPMLEALGRFVGEEYL